MNSRSMAGWIGFAGILMVLLGGLSVFEGLIALLEDNYYVVTPSGYLVFDITAWGWIMLIWGVVLALVGLALLGGASWARWTSIVLVSINVFGQLGFLGNTNDTVWLLITLTFNIIILYALIVRWHDSQRGATDSLRTPDASCAGGAVPGALARDKARQAAIASPRPFVLATRAGDRGDASVSGIASRRSGRSQAAPERAHVVPPAAPLGAIIHAFVASARRALL